MTYKFDCDICQGKAELNFTGFLEGVELGCVWCPADEIAAEIAIRRDGFAMGIVQQDIEMVVAKMKAGR